MKAIINAGSSKGKYIVTTYETNGKLDHVGRRYLIDIITEHYFNMGQSLVYAELGVLAEQIEELFPKESKVSVSAIIFFVFFLICTFFYRKRISAHLMRNQEPEESS